MGFRTWHTARRRMIHSWRLNSPSTESPPSPMTNDSILHRRISTFCSGVFICPNVLGGMVFSLGVQHDTTQHNITQHNTTKHNTTQHTKTDHSTTQLNTTQHTTTHHNTTRHNTSQNNTPQNTHEGVPAVTHPSRTTAS